MTERPGVTRQVSPRALLSYRKRPLTFGRDPKFFISDAVKRKVTPVHLVQKKALLKVLTAVETKSIVNTQVLGETNIFVRTAKDAD